MIDVGSIGSGIHVYKFNNCGPSPKYEYEVFKMTQPGYLHSLGTQRALRGAGTKLSAWCPMPCTGSADILEAVEGRIRSSYPFQLQEKDGVVIMDGKDEGVLYAWITANYRLGTIKASTPPDTPTYAVIDLGGASTQIVFKPVFAFSDMQLEDGEHKYDLQIGGRNHVLCQHSYLGYGLMRARRHVHRLADLMSTLQGMKPKAVAGNPCLAKGTQRVVIVKDEMTGKERKLVLAKDTICELKPCSFNGVYQPSLLSSFPNGKVLLLSYFYDRLSPLLLPSSSSSLPITVSTIASTARQVCKGRDEWLRKRLRVRSWVGVWVLRLRWLVGS
ncbi:uncharacterized protein LACBIDRAFT_318551 [Laccaria bicolor S238N-H82]|uniref:guanosine-diphosphatase n=1 Tax=Laccaria bicolor (strain S238N-H82 / ATCC MYA-4686) TaxID=486041 RepID=B0E2M7_LACBS|nr:uncharacterized protein LACBIDRAFT_318551 [Laccaria bicolor S238N-H82]EDQ98904.1 predicted protein [Laccaria bicolor S238N-H82]|eukprot:XP_001890449.1 predicted protein [Laccaria bicolor S238N-H82]